jgi:membrane glycosyltransferase
MLVLFVPKIIGLAGYLREPAARPHRLRAVLGTLLEVVLSALIAPVAMLTQSRSVYEILTGRDSGWNVQARDAARLPGRLLWRFHRAHVTTGVVLALMAWGISSSLLAWMSPALFGMIVAVPVSAFLGSRSCGHLLRDAGLLVTPEDDDVPSIARAAEAEAAGLAEQSGTAPYVASLAGLLADPAALERHLRWLDLTTRRRPGDPEAALAGALLKLSDGFGVEDLEGPPPNLEVARHTIDLLSILKDKTKGNLDFEESRLLDNTLTELRFRYVQRVNEINEKAKG